MTYPPFVDVILAVISQQGAFSMTPYTSNHRKSIGDGDGPFRQG